MKLIISGRASVPWSDLGQSWAVGVLFSLSFVFSPKAFAHLEPIGSINQ